MKSLARALQGCLAHTGSPPPPRTQQYAYQYALRVLGGSAAPCERGTLARRPPLLSITTVYLCLTRLAGYGQVDAPGVAVQIRQLWGGKGPGLAGLVRPNIRMQWKGEHLVRSHTQPPPRTPARRPSKESSYLRLIDFCIAQL